MQFIAAVVLQAHTRGFIDRQWVAMLRVEAARRKQREAEQRCASGRVSITQRAAHGPRLLCLTPLLLPSAPGTSPLGRATSRQTDVAHEQGEARLLVHQKARPRRRRRRRRRRARRGGDAARDRVEPFARPAARSVVAVAARPAARVSRRRRHADDAALGQAISLVGEAAVVGVGGPRRAGAIEVDRARGGREDERPPRLRRIGSRRRRAVL